MENLLFAYNQLHDSFRTLDYQKKIESRDLLQRVMENLISSPKIFETELEAFKYLRIAMSDRQKDMFRDVKKFDLLKKDNLNNIESRDYGITKQFISEVCESISRKLKDSQRAIFKMYFIEGYTCNEIAGKLDTYEMKIHREVKAISRVIHKEKISYLYDTRYVRYIPKKKREKIEYPDYQENDSEVIQLDLGDYEVSESIPYDYNFNPDGNYVFLKKDYYCNEWTATAM